MDSKPPECQEYVNQVTKEPVFIEHAFSKLNVKQLRLNQSE